MIIIQHHLTSCPMSDYFLRGISQDHWLFHICTFVLSLFLLPQYTSSTQIRSVSSLWWSHPWPSRQNLLFSPCISTQVSSMILCVLCHPSCVDVSFPSPPVSSSREGRCAVLSVAAFKNSERRMEGETCCSRNTKLPSVLFMLFFLVSLWCF